MFRGLALVAISLIISGCDFSIGGWVPDRFPMSISKGTCPTYSWEGNSVQSLVVKGMVEGKYTDRPGLYTTIWAIYTPKEDGLVPPIKHGEVPEGAVLLTGNTGFILIEPVDTLAYHEPLISGASYVVMLNQKDNHYYCIGCQGFIP